MDLSPVQHLQAAIAPGRQTFRLRFQSADVPRFGRGHQVATHGGAIDAVGVDQGPEAIDSLDRQFPERSQLALPDNLGETGEIGRETGDDLAAVAAGGTPADPLRLQQHNIQAAACCMQRGAEGR